MSSESKTPGPPARILFVILIVLAIPATIALDTATVTPEELAAGADASPLGYTWSLVLFYFPVLVVAVWLLRHPLYPVQKKALGLALAILLPLLTLLDVFLGNLFFTWPNADASLKVFVWGYVFGQGWVKNVPIEEFLFYAGGIVATILVYIWAKEYSMPAANLDAEEYRKTAQAASRVAVFHPRTLVVAVVAFAAALAYKKLGNHPYPEGFPGYFLFNLVAIATPMAMFWRVVGRFINLQAFLFMMSSLLWVSMLWEATLGLPYGWWGYHPQQMMGIFINAWSDLPLEAVLVWIAGGWASVTVYEVIKLYLHSERSMLNLLFGVGAGPAAESA